MKEELRRLIGNLNEVTVKGKQNMIIITDALNTLEQMYASLEQKEQTSEKESDS